MCELRPHAQAGTYDFFVSKFDPEGVKQSTGRGPFLRELRGGIKGSRDHVIEPILASKQGRRAVSVVVLGGA
jgi:hypothetical protein